MMSITTKTNRCFPGSLICGVAVVFVLAASSDSRAVDPEKVRQPPPTKAEDTGGQRLGDLSHPAADPPQQVARDRDAFQRNRHTDLNQEGSPAFHPPGPRDRHWLLGVRVQYLDTGARVTQVFRNTPAWHFGLEQRDVIVSIDGYQIGYVSRRFYEISTELNARAGRSGRVRLLVQNCRDDQLMNVDVQLARMGSGFPRERFGIPQGTRIDQADEDGRQRAGAIPDPKDPSDVESR